MKVGDTPAAERQEAKESKMIERRQYERFELEGGAFASLTFKFAVLGKISDISYGGLSFAYVASHNRSQESPFLDIVFTDNRYRLRKLPYRTVWDKAMFQEFSTGTISVRHCGVQFKKLTENQNKAIKDLIASYCVNVK